MKKISDLTKKELWQLFPIKLEQYNPCWKEWYEEEKLSIENTVGKENIRRINHIGSTSVKNLIAKPTIDILLEIVSNCDIDKLVLALERINYTIEKQQQKVFPHIMGMKGYTPNGFDKKVFHLHIREFGDWDELYFRDYLKLYPEIAKEYEELKINLKEKYEYDRDTYTDSKTNFIKKYTELAKKDFKDRYI